jgi:hypothetical protein
MARKKLGHDAVIETANDNYAQSKAVFVQAESLIDEAQEKLKATMEELSGEISELEIKYEAAASDFKRNAEFKDKLQGFTK